VVLTCLRPTYIIGPRNVPVVKSYQRNGVNIRGHNPQRQFIHEEDVAAAFVLALRCELRGAFNITPDDAVRLAEVWPLLGKRYVPTVSLRTARFVTWVRWRFFGAPVHPCWVEDMLVDFTGSNTRLKAQGWTPRYTCAAALRSAAGLNFQNA
jgi:nucleoside-diphosphate-sugar epimerase